MLRAHLGEHALGEPHVAGTARVDLNGSVGAGTRPRSRQGPRGASITSREIVGAAETTATARLDGLGVGLAPG